MSLFLTLPENPSNKSGWAAVSLVWMVCAILFIWAIPNTIALRNGLLIIGAINATFVIFSGRHLLAEFGKRWAPFFILILLYFWAIIHYQFFSIDPILEMGELKSLWLRSFAGSLLALALPICFYKNKSLIKYFFLFLFATPLINIFLYIVACFSFGSIITPQEYVVSFPFKKIETVFFGSLATAFSAANLAYLFSRGRVLDSREFTSAAYWILGIVICFVSAVVSNTKNGILIALFSVFFLGGYLLVTTLIGRSNRKLGLMLVLGLFIFSFGAWKVHENFSTGGWKTLVADIKTAVDVDRYDAWKAGNPQYIFPLNDQGQTVSGSTYMRVAWAVVGIRLIQQYPLGYGLINSSYGGLANLSGIDPGEHGQTHSGWVDYGLAYGIPGLLLLLGVLLCTLCLAALNPSFWALQALFIALVFFPLGLIAEIAWKQYFEATLFFVTYASATLLGPDTLLESAPPKR